MKKIFYPIALIAGIALANSLQAQCSIAQSSVIVNIKSVVNEPDGGCTAVFDFIFDLDDNNGNKWTHLHFWNANAYPTVDYSNGPGPTSSELNGGGTTPLLQTVSLDYHQGVNIVSPVYPADVSVIPQTSGITYTRTLISIGVTTNVTRYAINNISVHSHSCNPIDLRADVWSAQADNGKNVACGIRVVTIRADEPKMRGLIFCQTPRTYTASFQTKVDRDITFTAYKDVAPFGVFDAGDQLVIVDGPRTVTNTGDPAGITYNTFGPYSYTGGGVAGNFFDIWVVAKAVGIDNSNAIIITNTCAPLLVQFKSFTAVRNHTNVLLKWTTASEFNNTGFALERNTNGNWQEIAFVPSAANGGNSDIPLNYLYNDMNTVNGITQYRLRQVDFSMQSKYSNVVAVRGENQPGKIIVYPNPSGGTVNIVFETADVSRDVSLTDMAGRIISQWRGLTVNNMKIDNLKGGLYLLRVISIETGEQQVEKIVVAK
jgi:hypothetical protein